VANYAYDLVKEYNTYYQNTPILTAESNELINFRLGLSVKVGEVIKTAMRLLGADVPDRM
jgi:arginyl-tRNA synthetase